MNLVGVILARGGSKRLPGKNIRALCGKPLIAYTIEAARGAKCLSRVIVSTDDPEIARIAGAYGAEVPFLRPAELAGDESSSIAALQHAVRWIEQSGERIDAVALLQPTSPLRTSRHIDEAAGLFGASGVDTVTSVSPAAVHPWWCWREEGGELRPYFSKAQIETDRRDLPPALMENGAVYIVRRAQLEAGSLYGDRIAGYVMKEEDAIDIDTIADFERAANLIERRDAQKTSMER